MFTIHIVILNKTKVLLERKNVGNYYLERAYKEVPLM